MKMLKVTLFALCMAGCDMLPIPLPDLPIPLATKTTDWNLTIATLNEPGAVANAQAKAAMKPDAQAVDHDLQDQVVSNAATASSGAQLCAGSAKGCVTVDTLQPTDAARYYCFAFAKDGSTWTYLSNERTGVTGWTRDDQLTNFGSTQRCSF